MVSHATYMDGYVIRNSYGHIIRNNNVTEHLYVK